MLALTLVIGSVVGLVIVAFILLTEHLSAALFPADGSGLRRLVVPTLGALISGVLLYRFFPGARGSGIPQTKEALQMHDGVIGTRTVVGRFLCSTLSLASGIALGREGPSVHVGAGIASVIGQRLGLRPGRLRELIPVGSAAALAAAFNTPIAAVLFSLEEVLGDLHAKVLGSIVLSAATSWMVLHLLLGDEPLFHVPAYQLVHPVEFAVYALLGAAGGLVSVAFVKLLLRMRRTFRTWPAGTTWLQPAAGGLVVGMLGLAVPGVLGVGYDHVGRALNGQLALATMLLFLVLKLPATAAAYASGNAGGVFGPSLFLGAMLGGAVGSVAHTLLPDFTGGPGAYALVGMGTTFAGIIRVPLTSVIMIFEITRDYTIIVPLMIANLVSYYISSRLQPTPIYEALQHQDGVFLPPGRESGEPVARVRDLLDTKVEPASPADSLADARARVNAAPSAPANNGVAPAMAQAVAVVGDGRLLGVLTAAELDAAGTAAGPEATAGSLLPAAEGAGRAGRALPPLHPDHGIDAALRWMAQRGVTIAPVTSRGQTPLFLGIVSLPDVLRAYRVEGPAEPATAGPAESPRRLFVGFAVIVALVLAATTVSVYYFRERRIETARRAAETGNQLQAQGRTSEAVQQYRVALAVTGEDDTRLALGLALLELSRPDEARIYLEEVRRNRPDSGPASLALARIAARAGRIEPAAALYLEAARGQWPEVVALDRRMDAGFELAVLLAGRGETPAAVAHLLELDRALTAMPERRVLVAARLVALRAFEEARAILQLVVRQAPRNAAALRGLGEAELGLGNYRSARTALQRAVAADAADPGAARLLAVADRVLELHPHLRGLSGTARLGRTREVLRQVVAVAESCTTAPGAAAASPDLAMALDAARRSLALRGSRARQMSLIDSDFQLAVQVWTSRAAACAADDATTAALRIVLATE